MKARTARHAYDTERGVYRPLERWIWLHGGKKAGGDYRRTGRHRDR